MVENKSRVVSLDLFKGIAAYAVVFIHSTGGDYGSTDYWADRIHIFCDFAVPFFLATSFYLMIKKIYSTDTPYSLIDRLKILLIPYLSWTIIHLLFRVTKYILSHDSIKMRELISDPIAIFILGGSSVQLYFIPLLVSGIILATFMLRIVKRKHISINYLILCILGSMCIYNLMVVSNNGFHLGPDVAFENLLSLTFPEVNNNQLIRLVLVIISWLVRCLPYIFIAMLLTHPILQKVILAFEYKYVIIFSTIFLTCQVCIIFNIPIPISSGYYEIILGYSSLLFCLSLSSYIKADNKGIIINLGKCSFGIYLIHDIFIQFIRPIVYKIFPGHISVLTLLICATFSFIVSWLATYYLMKFKNISKYLFF